MLIKSLKKTFMYLLLALILYLSIGYLFHLVFFPEAKPEVANYFKPGTEFYSKVEGFRQTVIRQEKGIVYCSLQMDPFAAGPPEHIHTDFDEFFEIYNGELSLLINGKVTKVLPGEKVRIPRGTPHKPFNETGDTIKLKGHVAFPEKFAYNLVQVYGFMDTHPNFEKSPKTLFQLSMFASTGFDSYKGDGPPIMVQKVVGFLITPLARLVGYRSYYEEYDIMKKSIPK